MAAVVAVGPLLVTLMAVVALLVAVAKGLLLIPDRPSGPLAGTRDQLRVLLVWLLQPGVGRAIVFVPQRKHAAGATESFWKAHETGPLRSLRDRFSGRLTVRCPITSGRVESARCFRYFHCAAGWGFAAGLLQRPQAQACSEASKCTHPGRPHLPSFWIMGGPSPR